MIEKNISRLRRPDSEIVNLWLTHVGEMEIKMQILFLELQRLSKNGIPSIVVRYHNENFFLFLHTERERVTLTRIYNFVGTLV